MQMRRTFAMLAATASLLFAGSASAISCIGPGGGPNLVFGEIPQATACSGMFPGNLSESTINAFGFNWTFLDKEEGAANPFEGALNVDVDPGGLSGTWSINLGVLAGLYDTFVLGVKPDGGSGYFLVGNVLSGTWNTDSANIDPCPTANNCAGFALSHMNLYGRLAGNRVPEPGTLALVAAAALGLGFARRRRPA